MKTSIARSLVMILGCGLIAALVGLWAIDLAAAQTSGDGRINLITPLGGATVYCVDAAMQPASSYEGGGIRVLNRYGVEVLFVPAADILAPGAVPVLLGQGQGEFSILSLYRLSSGEFQLNGIDDKGQSFEFRWTGCRQRGAAPASGGAIIGATRDPQSTTTPTAVATRDIGAICAVCQAQVGNAPGTGCSLCVDENNIADSCVCPAGPPPPVETPAVEPPSG